MLTFKSILTITLHSSVESAMSLLTYPKLVLLVTKFVQFKRLFLLRNAPTCRYLLQLSRKCHHLTKRFLRNQKSIIKYADRICISGRSDNKENKLSFSCL
jgi:hypothetical protein